jgi:XTP/dITP diphosphohydrolase
VCELALATPDGRVLRARGECAGVIALKPRGEAGFGYDPVFWVPAYQATMAELGPEIKNKISHRAQALTAFKELMAAWKEELAGDWAVSEQDRMPPSGFVIPGN